MVSIQVSKGAKIRSLYSSHQENKQMQFNFSQSFRLSLNLTDFMRYSLDHADPAILFVCYVQEHVFAMVKP